MLDRIRDADLLKELFWLGVNVVIFNSCLLWYVQIAILARINLPTLA